MLRSEPLRCLLLKLHALDALHVVHGRVDGRVVHGLDGGLDSVHGPLLLLGRRVGLSGHAVALCVWRLERGQRLTSTSRNTAGIVLFYPLVFSHLPELRRDWDLTY